MAEQPGADQPQGSEDANTVDAGEPDRAPSGGERGQRPNLDRRQESISERRKPMGPPLPEPEHAEGHRDEPEDETDVEPVDPA